MNGDYPLVKICLVTYERTPVAKETIKGIKAHIKYPNLAWHIADDGSRNGHIQALVTEIGRDYGDITVSNTGGHSVGKSMNIGIEACLNATDFWLHWEDDWVPNFDIELINSVRLLQQNDKIGMVRFGRLSAGLTGHVIAGGDRLWWQLDKTKDEWCWTGHAALRHRRFNDAYGKYLEGTSPGKTELHYQDKFNRTPGPDIVWPAWARCDICDHIGDGYSFKEAMEDKHLTREQAVEGFIKKMRSAV